jgi:hypothetical protein
MRRVIAENKGILLKSMTDLGLMALHAALREAVASV